MARIGETLAPHRLGTNFRWLWAAFTVSNLGDGVVLAAGPLLVASITQEPFAVSMAVFLQRLPWLLFGLFAGALVDRVDRRTLVIIVDVLRALVLLAVATFVWSGTASLAVVLTAMFLLGTAEAFSDNASNALVPSVVPKAELGLANSRIFGSMIVTNQLAGPPLGALLFGIGAALPFGVNALGFLLSVVLMSRMRLVPAERPEERKSVRHEVAEGLRWLWAHAPVRTLAITITAFNVTFGAAFSVWVLYAQQRLGLGDVGFGLLISASAFGGLFGAAAYGHLQRRIGLAGLMRIGLVIETLSHLALALTTVPWVAGVVMLVFGIHATVWGTTSVTVRQRAVPERLMGRVSSVYFLGSIGATALGTLLGGWIAQHWGVIAPFWFAFVGSAVITVIMWRSFANITHTDETETVVESGT